MALPHPAEPSPRPRRSSARSVLRLASLAGWTVVVAGAALLLVPALLGLDRYVITGDSMAPGFRRGSVVFSRPVPVADLAVGDVITYRPPPATGVPQLVTHRIVSVDEGEDGRPVFVTRGDANAGDDPWTFQLAAGSQNVVQHDLPLLGHVLTFLSDPSKRMVIIGVPAGLIALRALLDLARALVPRETAVTVSRRRTTGGPRVAPTEAITPQIERITRARASELRRRLDDLARPVATDAAPGPLPQRTAATASRLARRERVLAPPHGRVLLP